ncbi:hypothetical protein NPIL_23401 [Nephila pilipes]|uniref:Uncharacterized protein n=1 Tax=Nephila pilipes TaxID=299642 RepID=A0A8X6TLG6_NEPPI|nr:hypothetical protein NPIL_23401 [Nephila pilipes]
MISREWPLFSTASLFAYNNEIDQSEVNLIELLGFADASESAYGAIVYCKCRSISPDIHMKLEASKYRVPLVKKSRYLSNNGDMLLQKTAWLI